MRSSCRSGANDGFVAYLNGREAARANCGPTNHSMFASQPAYNVSATTNVVPFAVGPANAWLVSGSNVLAIQAHNAEQPSTTNWPEQITTCTPTPEFRINAGLQLAGDTPVTLIGYGAAGGLWRCFVVGAKPSGGVVDMGLVTKSYTPPAGGRGRLRAAGGVFELDRALQQRGSSPLTLGAGA